MIIRIRLLRHWKFYLNQQLVQKFTIDLILVLLISCCYWWCICNWSRIRFHSPSLQRRLRIKRHTMATSARWRGWLTVNRAPQSRIFPVFFFPHNKSWRRQHCVFLSHVIQFELLQWDISMLSEKTLIFLYISFMPFKFILLSKGYFLFLCVGCSNWDVLLSRKHSVLFHISTSSKINILFPRQQSLFLVITTWSCTYILKRQIWDYSGTRNIRRSGRGLNCRLLKISIHAS